MMLAVHAGTMPMLVGAAACLGIGFGGGVVCVATVLSNHYGTKVFASLIGLSLAISTLGAIAPYVAGRLYDSGYGYQGVFYSLALWCGAGAAGSFCHEDSRPEEWRCHACLRAARQRKICLPRNHEGKRPPKNLYESVGAAPSNSGGVEAPHVL